MCSTEVDITTYQAGLRNYNTELHNRCDYILRKQRWTVSCLYLIPPLRPIVEIIQRNIRPGLEEAIREYISLGEADD